MKSFGSFLALALLLFLIGHHLWSYGKDVQRLAEAEKQVVTLHYGAPMEEYSNIEHSARFTRGLPWVADVLQEARTLRSLSEYWQGKYDQLDLPRDSSGSLVEKDPAILFVAANAAYRSASFKPGDPETEKQLNQISESYAEVLKLDPQDANAAYNYEFVARVRETLAKASEAKKSLKAATASASNGKRPIVTINGRQGAPPESNVVPFKTVVPNNGDERKQDEEAGKGVKKVRKG
jgi:hypothetical protein